MTVKILLKEMRTLRGFSQNGLAKALDMSLQGVQKIEYGKSKQVSLDTLNKLCSVLNCDAGDLIKYEPDMIGGQNGE